MQYRLDDMRPSIGEHVFIAPDASVIGQVTLGDYASVWFGAILRGDNEPLIIGERSNIQDLAVLHTDVGTPVVVGNNVTIGHKALVHSAKVGDNTLIGINAVVLSGAVIGRNCLIGAHALVTEGKVIPDNSVVMGAPGRVVREATADDVENLRGFADRYVKNGARYLAGFGDL